MYQTTNSAAADESSGVAVLDRTFALLSAFDADHDRLSLTELSGRTGLYKSTVLRLLAALEHGGYIRKLANGQYSIGPQPLRLAAIYQRSFSVGHVVEPLLKKLSFESGETASYYVRHEMKRVALFRVEPSRAVRAAVRIGQEYGIEQGASGKILLAFTRPYPPAHSIVRENYWAVSYGERDPETASVAAPVLDVAGELKGAMALSAPKDRLTAPEAMLAACRQVLNAASEATSMLGGDIANHTRSVALLTVRQFDRREKT